ncbi:unnamed protein product [Lactuca saligna]|uniref:Uncharacterized protein n=1 Tax=Lactuca saligna TaxID=75948 RepID=A0AA35Y1J2_LACSI|nr:unnamed protein product [Lactuca saligna]
MKPCEETQSNISRKIEFLNHLTHLSFPLTISLNYTHNSAHVHIFHESRLSHSFSITCACLYFRIFSNKQRRDSAAIRIVFLISNPVPCTFSFSNGKPTQKLPDHHRFQLKQTPDHKQACRRSLPVKKEAATTSIFPSCLHLFDYQTASAHLFLAPPSTSDEYLEKQGRSPMLTPHLVGDLLSRSRNKISIRRIRKLYRRRRANGRPIGRRGIEEEKSDTEDEEPMEAERTPTSRPSPPSPYRGILRGVRKTRQTARKSTLNHKGIQKHGHALSESMRKNLRNPSWLNAFAEERISGERITTRYEDGQGSGARVSAREIKEGENNTTHLAWRAGRLETQLTQHQNALTEMRGLLDAEIATRMQQDTLMVEADLQAQATLIRVGVSEEEIMTINGRLDAIGVQLAEVTRALGTYLRQG